MNNKKGEWLLVCSENFMSIQPQYCCSECYDIISTYYPPDVCKHCGSINKNKNNSILVNMESDFDSQEGVPNIGEIMTEQRRKDAIEYIMGQLESGYIDLGSYDQDELMIVEEAMELLIAVEKFNSLPLVNPISAEDLKKALERSANES